ncbi:MAG: 6-phosphofructokinase [Polyangiales bacterium]
MTSTDGFRSPRDLPRVDRRMLLVFDGGNAPGYSSLAVAMTEEATRRGYEVWAATEGFRSLCSAAMSEPRLERLILGRGDRYALLGQGIPARSMGRRVLDAGSDFRSERYVGFEDRERQTEAARTVVEEGFTHVVCVGGNGTLEGAKALARACTDPKPSFGFLNVSIDNDLGGDRAIGFVTGVEAGANVARGLYEDAYTHKRVYILEMMGNRSGRHALHCGVGARAHLIVLPFFHFPEDVMREIADALAAADHALVVVAEGWEKKARQATGVSASEHLRRQLEEVGLRDSPKKRVIAEPFSRYIRGVRPAFLDVSAAYVKATLLLSAFDEGKTDVMPFVIAAADVGLRTFSTIEREDGVERSLVPLLSRFRLPKFDAYVHDHFAVDRDERRGQTSLLPSAL